MTPSRAVLVQSAAETDAHADHLQQRAFDFTKPFFNTATAAAYVDSPSLDAFRKWVKRAGIAAGHCGRRLRFARTDLDTAMGVAHRRKGAR